MAEQSKMLDFGFELEIAQDQILSVAKHFLSVPSPCTLEKLISKNYFLNKSAKEAFKSYVRAYDSHHLKLIFDVSTLDLAQVAKSFGFTVPPAVDLQVTNSKNSRPRKRTGGGGFGFYKNINRESKPHQNIKYLQPKR
ncbi:ATP-dependent RNA helicase ddx18 [Homalodisca vitripennis]|nr:ATP-dependent RNA helicase ddx18 [Homalodisca vitripennis]